MYIAERGRGASVMYDVVPDAEASYTYAEIRDNRKPLPLADAQHDGFRVAVSRSHQTPETHEHVDMLRREHPELEIIEQGSSYKFCLLAEGTVDYYVRTTTTSEWDTAAGELILSEAGGTTSDYATGAPLTYNKEVLDNPWFIAKR
jgi:3'(2'), 5'-bisphosphate nucleotidase